MKNLRAKIDELRAQFARLSQQEQFLVLGGVAGLGVLIILLAGLSLSTAVAHAEYRVKVKADQLAEVITLQGMYKARVQARETRMRQLGRVNIRLVSVVEDTARQAGVEIGQLRPEEGEPSAEGIVESSVDLRVSNLSSDRLQDFLMRLESAPGAVVVRRIRIDRPYGKDSLNLEATVTSLRKAG